MFFGEVALDAEVPREANFARVEQAQMAAAKLRGSAHLQLVTRGPEGNTFPLLKQPGISATLYNVFSRGLLTRTRTQLTDSLTAQREVKLS